MADRRPEIKNILIVLSASAASALMIAAFFVMNYGPSGRYLLDAVLIQPAMLNQLNYNDNNPRIGHSDRYIFQKIVWIAPDFSSREIQPSVYEKLYAILQADKSVNDPNVEELFQGVNPKLVLWVHTESPSAWQNDGKVFQEIEFQKDYYRVSLHEASPKIAFAYFSHPGILETVQELL